MVETLQPYSSDIQKEQIRKCLSSIIEGKKDNSLLLLESDRLFLQDKENYFLTYMMGLVATRFQKFSDAIRLFEKSHALQRDAYEPIEVLSIMYAYAGRQPDSLYFAKMALAAKKSDIAEQTIPEWLGDFERAFFNAMEYSQYRSGVLAYRKYDVVAALDDFRQSTDLFPEHLPSWVSLIECQYFLRKHSEMLVSCAKAMEALKAQEDWQNYHDKIMGYTIKGLYNLGDIVLAGDLASQMNLTEMTDLRSLCLCLAPFKSEDVHTFLRPYEDLFEFDYIKYSAKRSLKIGIVSEFLSYQQGAALLSSFAQKGGVAVAEYIVYSLGPVSDNLLDYFKLANRVTVKNLHEVDLVTVATIMYNDEIDILLDMDGVAGSPIDGLMIMKPAPICAGLSGDGQKKDWWFCDIQQTLEKDNVEMFGLATDNLDRARKALEYDNYASAGNATVGFFATEDSLDSKALEALEVVSSCKDRLGKLLVYGGNLAAGTYRFLLDSGLNGAQISNHGDCSHDAVWRFVASCDFVIIKECDLTQSLVSLCLTEAKPFVILTSESSMRNRMLSNFLKRIGLSDSYVDYNDALFGGQNVEDLYAMRSIIHTRISEYLSADNVALREAFAASFFESIVELRHRKLKEMLKTNGSNCDE